MRENSVARIRRLLGEAVEEKQRQLHASTEAKARRQFEVYEFNTGLPALNTSKRARAERQIGRIVAWYAWAGPELARQLDRLEAPSLEQLDDAGVEQLLEHLAKLEDCVQQGLDSPDAPAAR